MKGNPSSHRVYLVEEGKNDAERREVGAVCPHKNGKGYGIRFEGRVMRMVMREPEPKESRSDKKTVDIN